MEQTTRSLKWSDRRIFGLYPWIPFLLLVAIPGVAVVSVALVASLSKWDVLSGKLYDFPTIFSYWHGLYSERWRILVQQILRAAFVATLDVMVAAPAAHFLVRRIRREARMATLALFMVPFFIDSATRAFSWKVLLGHAGPIATMLRLVGAPDAVSHALLYNSFAVTISLMASSIPFAMFPILGEITSVKSSIWQLSDDLGLTTAPEFFGIAAPLAARGLTYGWMTSFIVVSLSNVEVEFTGGMKDQALARVITGLFDKNEPAAAIALGIVLLLSMAVVLLFVQLVIVRLGRLLNIASLPLRIPGFRVLEQLSLFLVIGLVVAPAVTVLATATGDTLSAALTGRLFSLISAVISDQRIVSAGLNTLILCISVALPTALASIIAALTWWQQGEFRTIFLIALCFAAIPGEAYAIGLFGLLQIMNLRLNSLVPIIVAQITWTFPFCLLTAATGFAGIKKSLLSAAEDLGAPPRNIVGSILFKAAWPEMFLTVLVGAVLSMNELSRASFLAGGKEFASEYVASRLRSGDNPADHLLACLGTCGGIAVVASFFYCWRRSHGTRRDVKTPERTDISILTAVPIKVNAAQAGR